MIFSNITFVFAFLPLFLLVYYLVPFCLKNVVILFFSLVFYAWGEPIYILLMIYSIVVNYVFGLLIDKYPKHSRSTMIFTVTLDLFMLGFFKYYGFVIENINSVFHLSIPIKELELPIGISFYTFQTLSYIIDLYRKEIPVQTNIISYGAYITMFPQLIAGPIVRYSDVQKELESRTMSLDRFGKGAQRFIFGLSKKVLLANAFGALFDAAHAYGADMSVLMAWLCALAYTMQIYFDFSGYSDMAIGLGDMLGFTFLENFDYPYISKSVTEFWRRWHISLGTWFREYVYIPLGGNRVSVIKHIRNILIVWILTGLWHGASWNFVIWGLYYGIILLWEKYIFKPGKFPAALKHIFTMIAVTVGWVIFSADDMADAWSTIKIMFFMGDGGIIGNDALYYLKTNVITMILGVVCCVPLAKSMYDRLLQKSRAACMAVSIALLILCIAYMVTQNYNPFLYFRF